MPDLNKIVEELSKLTVVEAAELSKTLASASTMEKELRAFAGDKTAKAKQVGELIAKRAKEKEFLLWSLTAVVISSTAVLQQLQQVLVQMDWSSNGRYTSY